MILLSPYEIKFTQRSISCHWTNYNQHGNAEIDDTLNELLNGEIVSMTLSQYVSFYIMESIILWIIGDYGSSNNSEKIYFVGDVIAHFQSERGITEIIFESDEDIIIVAMDLINRDPMHHDQLEECGINSQAIATDTEITKDIESIAFRIR